MSFQEKVDIKRFFNNTISLLILAIILFVSINIRIKYISNDRMWPDEALYAWNAQRISQNPSLILSKELNEFHPPLFPLFLAITRHLISPDIPDYIAYQIINLWIAILGVIAIYLAGRLIDSNFTGLLSALVLSFNPIYLRYSCKLLMEGTEVLSMLFLTIVLLKVDPKKRFYDISIAAIIVFLICLKLANIMVLFFIVSYYFFALDDIALDVRLKKIKRVIGLVLFPLFLLLLHNVLIFGKIFPDLSVFNKSSAAFPYFFYLVSLKDLLYFPFLWIFGLLYLFFGFKHNKKAWIWLTSWLFISIIFLSFAKERLPRYALMFLPSFIIISVMEIKTVLDFIFCDEIRKYIAKIVCLCLFLGYTFNLYPTILYILQEDNKFSNGFIEAGEWIKRNSTKHTLIICSSPRQIRFYSGINFKRFGGQIIDYFKIKDSFREALLDNFKGHIILELDNWNTRDKLIINPTTQKEEIFLQKKGFRVAKEIKKMRYKKSDNEKIIAPAMWIFERSALNKE